VRSNPAGEPRVAYRIGTHASFKAALLARLSSTDYPALAALRTRADDDFTIATCDTAAVLLDVLGFYQERYANELYLRTATERRSLLELARLIGYRLAPGVAASTRLAFVLEEAPGAPALAAEPVTIPAGTRVQSVPGPGEEPQTFETVEAITARVEWNAIPVQRTERQVPGENTRDLFVAGINTQVQTGDVILIVGDERMLDNLDSDVWKVRVIAAVEPNAERDHTRLVWRDPLGANPPAKGIRAYVLRTRAGLFGHNAPDARLMRLEAKYGLTTGADSTLAWVDYKITKKEEIDLDGDFPKVLAGGWFLMVDGSAAGGTSSLPGVQALCRIKTVTHRSRSGFGTSSKITRLEPDTTLSIPTFDTRLFDALVLAQSEELPLAERPLAYPLYGSELVLARRSAELAPKQMLAISGKRQRLRVLVDKTLEFKPDDGTAAVPLRPGDSFILTAPPLQLVGSTEVAPADLEGSSGTLQWRLADREGHEGVLEALLFSQVSLQPALKDDPVVRELCRVGDDLSAVQPDGDRTTLQLKAPLANVYDRATATVCANLARTTHGETVSEIAGSGDAASASQRFTLKQSPLTYVSAKTTSGREATLGVRVGGLLWDEVDSLFERGASEHVYALRQDDEGRTIVQFGDGVEGGRLPTSQDNVRFTYRKFLGSGGNLPAGRLTTLLGRPLGVKGVTQPAPASGGEDAESRDDARRNAPLTMLTFRRAVSVQDYTDFARSFAGIAKAQAIWVGSGAGRGIFVTVAGPDGKPVAADSDAMTNLVDALRKYGDPLIPLHVLSYAAPTFTIKLKVKVAESALAEKVLPATEQALRAYYAFEQRDFGQTVSIDEVMAVIHTVSGVEAADVEELHRVEPGAQSLPRLFAFPASVDDDGTMHPAELLTLDAAPLQMGLMT